MQCSPNPLPRGRGLILGGGGSNFCNSAEGPAPLNLTDLIVGNALLYSLNPFTLTQLLVAIWQQFRGFYDFTLGAPPPQHFFHSYSTVIRV
jgi:hypothetical protein